MCNAIVSLARYQLDPHFKIPRMYIFDSGSTIYMYGCITTLILLSRLFKYMTTS